MPKPKYPEILTKEHDGRGYGSPYYMGADSNASGAYNSYFFAKMQYEALVNFLNTTTEYDKETGQRIGYGKNEFGFQKNMDAETLDFLREKCHKLNMAGQKLLKAIENHKSSPEKSRLIFDVQYITKMARADANAINNVDPNNIPSYTHMRRTANDVVIDAGNSSLGTVGAFMSSRMELRYVDENGVLQTGYFTQDKKVGELKEPGAQRNYEIIKVKKSENINSRNSSMSDMAALLNMENLICESREMTILHKGKEVHGSFMTKAKGYSFDDLISDDSLLASGGLNIDMNSTVRSATDMMVLDYICLNVDRHQNNHYYNVETDQNGNRLIKGFYGIDNDMSFGTAVSEYGLHHLPPVSAIKYLHPDTAARVMSLTKETITATLVSSGRTEEEINACWRRVNQIQSAIQYKDIKLTDTFTEKHFKAILPKGQQRWVSPAMNAGNLVDNYNMLIVDRRAMMKTYKKSRDKFVNRKLNEFAKKYSDEFQKPGMRDKIEAKLKEIYYQQEKQKIEDKAFRKKYAKGIKGLQNRVFMDNKLTITQQSKDFNNLFNKLWSPTENDIPEYHQMYNSMKDLSKLMKSFEKQGLNSLSDMDRNKMADAFKKVHEQIRNYIPAISNDPSKNDIKRITISQGIMDVCIKAQDQRERAVNELNETMASAFKALQQSRKEINDIEKEKGPNCPEYLMAKKGLEAKSVLAGFLGNLEQPSKDDKARILSSLATLTILDKLNRMKTEEPIRYEEQMNKITSDQISIEDLTKGLLAQKGFKQLAQSIDYKFALTNHAEKTLSIECDKIQSFNKLLVGATDVGKIADREISNMLK